MLTGYEEGGGPKQDILQDGEDEEEEMEVDARGGGDSKSECMRGMLCYIACH